MKRYFFVTMSNEISTAGTLPPDLTLAWAGHLGPDAAAAVDALAETLGVSGAVVRLGFVSDDDLSALYREARALVLVSRCEGFGLPVVEAMASGCPVVTTDEGSLPELSGEAALRVPVDDHEAIGGAFVRLLRDPELRASLSAKGRARAPMFSRTVQAREMMRVYRDVLGC